MRDWLVPLKEAVSWALVRPRQLEETDHGFEFGEAVDVFLDGGWWEGAITEVLENSMYMVFFRFSRQQERTRKSRMRVHREWFNGIWKPPLEEEVSSSKIDPSPTEEFGKGMHVEIRINEDGFQGSWFAATIVKATRDDKFLVEYQSLRTENDSGFLKEEVDTQYMRPMPPALTVVDGFTQNEEVDALYNDGWWEGVITKILHGSRCRVYFKLTDDEMVFHQSKLRPHQNWIDGEWIIPSRV
ncbi:hypothetical protein SLEP1_g29205 [Rubroshorea leprosula]|uniref:Agenet domain-containing protein n=1 Tax=Rubroshorea leprosula TaxID=152421 RepID=A0AAV5K7U9_9ROSI|nr:hypothetical protein SLEP1_g29205 [Rubroshorea leprosula]